MHEYYPFTQLYALRQGDIIQLKILPISGVRFRRFDMAIYEYFCPSCRQVVELIVPMSRLREQAYCPDCSMPLEKVISNFASTANGKLNVPDKGPYRQF
jgi:putative FmdB family regulatory protein